MQTVRKMIGLVALVGVVPLAGAGCSASACAGSGCNKSTIEYGTSYSQKAGGGDISPVGKTDTFSVGQPVTMVAHLSENAGTTSLKLRASGGAKTMTIPYSLSSPGTNVVANTLSPAALRTLGLDKAGHYTLSLLHGSKELAKGDLTEK